jgi:hypothetical protein
MRKENWIKWLQARIPELKRTHNELWLRSALDGYYEYRNKEEEEQQKIANSVDRYFLFAGENRKLFNLNLESNKTYHSNTITHENNTLLDYINFSLSNGYDVSDFIELKTINSSIGGVILALESLCTEVGIKCEVKIWS